MKCEHTKETNVSDLYYARLELWQEIHGWILTAHVTDHMLVWSRTHLGTGVLYWTVAFDCQNASAFDITTTVLKSWEQELPVSLTEFE